jgi:hypothetical protein
MRTSFFSYFFSKEQDPGKKEGKGVLFHPEDEEEKEEPCCRPRFFPYRDRDRGFANAKDFCFHGRFRT